MYLKEIKISGFKSFADKMNISLDNDITCIVGPNGSGKSNIVDAVRWVLGEQSVKNLRGSSAMTDVIFAGSKSRNPLPMASVTLVFDNSDNYLKVPYTEISVARKVYRTGENEYYINNEKCRLKDISDLFLDSGMGKYAFNIISQGEVSKIISNSSEERRVVIEEAAGILKYQKRKEEALKKLSKTNENLVRVTDIMKELEIQIGPLEEQSKKASEYTQAKKQLEKIEIALIVNDLEKINHAYQNGKRQIDSLKNEIVYHSTEESKNATTLEEKKKDIEKIRSCIAMQNQKYLEYVKEEERTNSERIMFEERRKYSSKDKKVHENFIRLKEQKLVENNKLLSLKTELEIIMKKIQEEKTKKEEKTKLYNKEKSLKNELESSLMKMKQKLEEMSYKKKYLQDYIENGSSNANVKKVLTNPKLSGVCNTVSRLIDTSNDYALALEVALLSSKDYVVVETRKNASECIEFLKENNLGRVTFYPLDAIEGRKVDDATLELLKNEEGFISVFKDVVEYQDKYKNIVESLLGNVLLVDTIEHANEISRKIRNRYKIVTLTGEVLNVGGSITGGVLKTKSVISEKYELNKLQLDEEIIKEDMKKTDISLKHYYDSIKNYEEEILEIEKQILILENERKIKDDNYQLRLKEYDKIKLELQNLSDLLNDNLDEEENRLTEKYYAIVSKKEELEQNMKDTKKQEESILEEIEKLEATRKIELQSTRNLEIKLKDLEINSAKMGSHLDQLLNILSEDYQMTYENAKEHYILEIDEDIARSSVNKLKGQIKRIGVVNLGAIEEYTRVKERYDFLDSQSTDLKNAIATLLKIMDELDEVMNEEFLRTFNELQVEFNKVFKDLFGGGSAKLQLTDKDNLLTTGVDIIVTPPGKKVSTISLLSGGEKTLTAISLLFAILNIKRIPFCIFDEVEAALDEANVDKVGAYLKQYVGRTQLIVITHKKKTMEYAKNLYGITMQESGVSKLVSVKLI